MDYTEIEVEQIDGSLKTFLLFDKGNGEMFSISKDEWLELEAAKEIGTIS